MAPLTLRTPAAGRAVRQLGKRSHMSGASRPSSALRRRCTVPVVAHSQSTGPAASSFVNHTQCPSEAARLVTTQAAAAAAAGGDAESSKPGVQKYTDAFLKDRRLTYVTMFLGYAAFYMTRLSLGFAAPTMMEDPALGLDMKKIGGLTSILPMCYGVSKFLSGVLGARTSPTYLLAGGLAATSLINIAFGASSAYIWFCVLWGMNGLLQGLGAPACARLMTSWWSDTERGTVWGVWTASNNVGGFLAPILVGNVARAQGWRWAMYAPGVVGIAVAVIVLLFMKSSPEDYGHAPPAAPKPKQAAGAPPEKKPSMLESLTKDVLKNPYVWLFAISYFFVYVIRQGTTSWFIFYLKSKGVENVATQVSGLELGGLAGSLSAGALSDHLAKKNKANGSPKGNVGLRVQVAIAYTLLTAVFLFAFWGSPNIAWLRWLLVAGVGFSLYGPQMLIGLCGAETVAKESVSASQGFLGWISYLGAANAGVPLAAIVEKFGWNAYFSALGASCLIVVLLILPCVNLKSYSQRVEEENAKTA